MRLRTAAARRLRGADERARALCAHRVASALAAQHGAPRPGPARAVRRQPDATRGAPRARSDEAQLRAHNSRSHARHRRARWPHQIQRRTRLAHPRARLSGASDADTRVGRRKITAVVQSILRREYGSSALLGLAWSRRKSHPSSRGEGESANGVDARWGSASMDW